MADPVAYFITGTCYGTWLHGDDRGSVDKEHNLPESPLLNPNAPRRDWEATKLKGSSIILDSKSRAIVHKTIEDHCRIRRWGLHAVNVRTNHVHVVVTAPDVPPERVLNEFKVWSTRRLRGADMYLDSERIWTRHGSTRYLNNRIGLERAIQYVLEQQD